jgi:uncharacterized membrane protein
MLAMVLLVVAALGCGIMAGLLFAFSNFVMRSLARQSVASGIRAMQAINADIQNPLFFLLFVGTAIASLAVVVSAGIGFSERGALTAMIGGALYLCGVIGVTVFRNVHLNNRLDSIDPDGHDAPQRWEEFLARWTPWNHVRTVAAMLACLLLILSIHLSPIRPR